VRQAGYAVEHSHSVFPLPPEDEARHRVRTFHNALAALQYPVAAAYRVTRRFHGALAPIGKIRFLTARKI
jgi:hypothetical protein